MADQNDPLTTRPGVPFFHLNQVGKGGGFTIHFNTVAKWLEGVAYANQGARWPDGQRMTRPDEAGTPAVRVYRGNLQHANTVLLGLMSIVLGSDENKVHGYDGLPPNTLGIDGDLSVAPLTGTIFSKASGVWSQWSSGSVEAPSLDALPVISGTPQVGQTLTATSGTWLNSPTAFARQWLRGGTPIANATNSTYQPVTADIGATLTIRVTASNSAGDATATSAGVGPVQAAAAPVPVVQTAPSLTAGEWRVGVPITINDGAWSNSPTGYARQWLRNGVAISGATGTTYTPVQDDVDTLLSVRVIASNATGPSQPATSATVGPILNIAVPANTAAPVITGTAQVGQTLTSSNGNWTGSPGSFARRWLRGGTAISGAAGQTYQPVTADIGFTLTVEVIASNAGGPSQPATSLATSAVTAAPVLVPVNTALPTISGTPQVGQTLTGADGSWMNSPTGYARQWLRGGVAISGATGQTYQPVTADIGAVISFSVTASNASGPSAVAAVSLPTSAVTAAPILVPVNTAAPVITGTAQVGQTLTGTDGTWSNSPISFVRQWLRAGSPISGANGSTYQPVTADVGQTLTFSVLASNSGGPAVSAAVSSPTSAVVPAAVTVPVNTAAPVITGTAKLGQMLLAGDGSWTNSPTGYARQWLRNGVAISGATERTYQLQTSDMSAQISVEVLASNVNGAAASPATSVSTSAVTQVANVGARTVIFGDSITLRYYQAWAGCTLTASAGVGTITHAIPAGQQPLVGQKIKVYTPGGTQTFLGEFTIASRPSNTQFTYNYVGADAAAGLTVSIGMSNALTDQSYFNYLQGTLSQRMNLVSNGGVGGETSAQILARMDSQISVHTPDLLIVNAGANDLVQGIAESTLISNWTQILSKAAAVASRVIVITTAPIAAGGVVAYNVQQHVRAQSAQYANVTVVDAYAMAIDPASGSARTPRTGYLCDGVHWGQRFALQVGQTIADFLSPLVPPAVGPQGANLVTNGTMTGTPVGGVAPNWTLTTSTLQAASPSVAPNPNGSGNLQQVVCTSNSANDTCLIEHSSIHAAMVAGARYRLWQRVKATGLSGINTIGAGMNMTAAGTAHTIRSIVVNPDAAQTDFVDCELLLRSEWFTAPAGLTAANPRCAFVWRTSGGGTVALGDVFLEEFGSSGPNLVQVNSENVTVNGEQVEIA